MILVYFNHANLTTEFSRSSCRRRSPCCRQILSSSMTFSDKLSSDHPFQPATTSTSASKVPLSVKVNNAPFQQATLLHVSLFFSARGGTWITVSTCASYTELATYQRASLDYSHPLLSPESCSFASFSLRPSFLGFLPFFLDFFEILEHEEVIYGF